MCGSALQHLKTAQRMQAAASGDLSLRPWYERDFTTKAFQEMGYASTASQTNFIFVNLKSPAAAFRDACREQGVLVGRDFPPYEKTHARISMGTMDEMQRAVQVFRKVLGNTTIAAGQNGR